MFTDTGRLDVGWSPVRVSVESEVQMVLRKINVCSFRVAHRSTGAVPATSVVTTRSSLFRCGRLTRRPTPPREACPGSCGWYRVRSDDGGVPEVLQCPGRGVGVPSFVTRSESGSTRLLLRGGGGSPGRERGTFCPPKKDCVLLSFTRAKDTDGFMFLSETGPSVTYLPPVPGPRSRFLVLRPPVLPSCPGRYRGPSL